VILVFTTRRRDYCFIDLGRLGERLRIPVNPITSSDDSDRVGSEAA